MSHTVPASAQRVSFSAFRSLVAASLVLFSSLCCGARLSDLTIAVDQLSNSLVAGAQGTVVGGNAVTAKVTLDAAAPPGGETIALTSSNAAAATVPATVMVAGGALTATFTITTKAKLPGPLKVTIKATLRADAKIFALAVVDDVTEYAKACYTRLKIKEKDLPGPFKCKDGAQLLVQKDGRTLDIAVNNVPNPLAATDFPADCDFPAWLPNGQQCYGNSFIQQLKIAGNDEFEGALLCRHKTVWAGVCSGGARDGKTCGDAVSPACGAGSKCLLGDKDFPDIAMILYNKDNGETCWFQTDDSECTPGEKRCDGTKVPAPHTADAKQVFWPPSASAKVNCVRCHDNGPWMSSRWMDNSTRTIGNGKALADNPAGPYLNNGPHFDKWAKTTFVTVNRDGLPKEGRSCTSCHKIHAKEITPDPTPPFADEPGYGRNYITLAHWLDYSVALDFPPGASATGKKPDDAHALWMPFSRASGPHGLALADWNKVYKPHIDALRACMEKKGVETDENKKKGSNCAVRPVAVTNPAPGAPGARLRGDLNNGTVIVKQVTPGGFVAEPTVPVAPGTSLTLSWDADSRFHACAIEASLPTGVPPVPSNAGGWNLQDPPALLGPFSAPGEYRFDMYCEDEESANFTLAISGPPAPFLQIEAIVDGFARPMATNWPGPAQTLANARVVDAIFVHWGTDAVKDDCVVTELIEPGGAPTGRTFPGNSGFVPIVFGGATDQAYSLSCTGADNNAYTVKTTLRPTASTMCDVNGDGKIDKADIDAIFAARNVASVPFDRRDVDGDKLITVNDARICVNRCNSPKCVP